MKAHKFVHQGGFFFSLFSFKCDDKLSYKKKFTDLLFYAYMYVGIHQVRTLVFDNYQRCPVPLNVYQVWLPKFTGWDK